MPFAAFLMILAPAGNSAKVVSELTVALKNYSPGPITSMTHERPLNTKRRKLMAGKNTSVFGIYPSYSSVEEGVEALKMAGFRNTDSSVLFPENVGTKRQTLLPKAEALRPLSTNNK